MPQFYEMLFLGRWTTMWRTGKGEKEEERTQRKQEKGKSGRKMGEVV